jgi:dihydroneopterin aldolase
LYEILIEDLELDIIIGILDFERKNRQKVVVNVKIEYQYKKESFIDYVDIINIIETLLLKNRYYLLEDAILEIGDNILDRYLNIKSLYLKIVKPDIIKNGTVGVSKLWN